MAFKDKAQETAYKNQFARDKYDRINYTGPKGIKDDIQAAAQAAGQSVNAYITQAVKDRMDQDAKRGD